MRDAPFVSLYARLKSLPVCAVEEAADCVDRACISGFYQTCVTPSQNVPSESSNSLPTFLPLYIPRSRAVLVRIPSFPVVLPVPLHSAPVVYFSSALPPPCSLSTLRNCLICFSLVFVRLRTIYQSPGARIRLEYLRSHVVIEERSGARMLHLVRRCAKVARSSWRTHAHRPLGRASLAPSCQ